MSLNVSKGDMYNWITHTYNTVKGECPHLCSYCYMHRWGKQKPVRFDEKELKTDLGSGNFIFVGSSCDMFADEIPDIWIMKTLNHCEKFDSRYLFQTKNPQRIWDYIDTAVITDKSVICTTLETNRWYPEVMCESPHPMYRASAMSEITDIVDCYLTVEPILDFDIYEMLAFIADINPKQVNIGADSGNNHLPEPPKEKILELIAELEKFTVVKQKSNLKRLLK